MIPLYLTEMDLRQQFKEAKTEWEKIRKAGSDEPVYSTSMCLNLIRWKMIEIKKAIKRTDPLSDISDLEIPIKVRFDYKPKHKGR